MTNARFCIIPARALGDKRLNRTDIMVLNALGMFGDRDGWSFPSTSTIAEMIQAHRTSVSKAISNLVACGYVEARLRYRDDGGQTSNEYRILFDAPAQGTLDFGSSETGEITVNPPVVDSPPPCSESTTPPVASGTTPPVAEPLHRNVPKITTQVNDSDKSGECDSPDVDVVGMVDFKRVLFSEGLKLLGGKPESNRPLVGRLIRDYGEQAVVMAMLEAQRTSAVDPKAYIMKLLKAIGNQPSKTKHSGFTQQDYSEGTDGFIVV